MATQETELCCSKSTERLFNAIHFGEGEETILTLLQECDDIDARDSEGYTPLLLACVKYEKIIVDLLIKFGANVNVCDRDENTVLHYAIINVWEDTAKYLAKKVLDVNARNITDETPLHIASSTGYEEVVKCLLEEGADIEQKNLADFTPLLCAAQSQSITTFKFLISIANVDGNERLLLYFASLNRWTETVQFLVERLPDLNERYVIGETDFNARSSGGHLELVKCLIKGGTELNTRMIIQAALYEASFMGHKEVVKWIVKKGAEMQRILNIDAKVHGRTSLYCASRCGHLEVVKYLVEEGADINIRGDFSQTALQVASENGHLEIVKCLLEKGAEINTRDVYGLTALHLASVSEHVEIVRCLLEKGAYVDMKNCKGVTPLLWATAHSCKGAFDLLMHFGANVNVSNWIKITPLHCASENGLLDVVMSLVKRECNLNAKQSGGLTALALACWHQKLDIVEYLLQAGACWDTADKNGDSPLNYLTRKETPDFKLIKLFIEKGAYLKPVDYDAIVKSSSLKVLQDEKLCGQSIINQFNNHDLPELYKLPSSQILPRVEEMKIVSCCEVAQAIEQTVGFEIQTKGHCNILDVRLRALNIFSVRSFLEYDKRKSELKNQAANCI